MKKETIITHTLCPWKWYNFGDWLNSILQGFGEYLWRGGGRCNCLIVKILWYENLRKFAWKGGEGRKVGGILNYLAFYLQKRNQLSLISFPPKHGIILFGSLDLACLKYSCLFYLLFLGGGRHGLLKKNSLIWRRQILRKQVLPICRVQFYHYVHVFVYIIIYESRKIIR